MKKEKNTKFIFEDSNLIEFEKGKWVDYDGNLPTKEQINKHICIRERNRKMSEKLRKAISKEKVSDPKKFEKKYRKSIEEFFECDNKDNSWEDYSGWDKDDLIYNLSTSLFDAFCGGDMGNATLEIKRLFPDIYWDVLEGFCLGNHDT